MDNPTDLPSPAAPFSEAWPPAKTQDFLERPRFPSQGTHEEQAAWGTDVGAPAHRDLAIACGRHVAWLMTQGRVGELSSAAKHARIPFLSSMEKLRVEPDNEYAQFCVGQHVARVLEYFLYPGEDGSPVDAQAVHGRVQAMMDAGNFRGLFSDLQTCRESGKRLQVQVEGWQFQVGTVHLREKVERGQSSFAFVPLAEGDIVPQTVAHAPIPVPSGQLLICDWFRIPAFNALAVPVDDDEGGDALSSAAGRAARTQRYAERLGVAHVFGRSPSILASPGAVKVGYLDPNVAEPEGVAGTICADLRWTTIVDRAHLQGLLAPALGADEAKRQVEDFVANNRDVIQVQVEPGTHHLYFAGDGQSFSTKVGQDFDVGGLGLDAFEQPVFVLTDRPLVELAVAPAPSRPGPRA